MATVDEVSGPYSNHLVSVLPSGDGICTVCHTTCGTTWSRCYQCYQAADALAAVADAVSFVALAVKGEQLARELWLYKSGAPNVRERPTIGLAAVFWRWLVDHESCLASAAGIARFTIVTSVPSTSGRTDHPLQHMLGQIVTPTASRYATLLECNPELADGSRTPEDRRFQPVVRIYEGAAVLLVDDTWTTGSHAQSAASALRQAGAGCVGVVALGRHFHREQPGDFREAAEAYYRSAQRRGWDWSKCCLCDDR